MSKTTKYIIKALNEYTPDSNKEFNNETALGVAIQAYVTKYPNDKILGEKVRKLVNSFNKINNNDTTIN